jgi:hypothetical protein
MSEQSFYKVVKQYISAYLGYLKSKNRLILLVGISFGILGLVYSYIKTLKYTARTTFVVEDSKAMGGSGIMGALSGQFGSEILGALGGSNLLSGENIIELSKSRSLIRKTLLSAYDSNQSLADVYANTYKLKTKWKKSRDVNADIFFHSQKAVFSRTEDSLLNTLIDKIIKKDIQVFKPDRRLGLFEMNVIMLDEKLADLFCRRLLIKTSDLYIQAKTKRLVGNINRLQHLADSLRGYANRKSYNAAMSEFGTLDVNPQYYEQGVQKTINARDEMLSSTVYSEVIKNLEISKMSLLQETPTIQIIDSPDTPLPDNHIEWYEGLLGGLFGGLFISSFILLFLYDPTPHKLENL